MNEARKIRDLLLSTDWKNKRLGYLFLSEMEDVQPILDTFLEKEQVIFIRPQKELQAYLNSDQFQDDRKAFFWPISSAGNSFTKGKGPPYYIVPQNTSRLYLHEVGDARAHFDQLQVLSYFGITALGWENFPFVEIPLLEHFSASECHFQQIPEAILKAVHLRHLFFTNNQLNELPSAFAFEELRTLNLSTNQLERVPNWEFDCPLLDTLYLKSNPIEEIKMSFKQLPNLKTLSLEGTKIKELPDGLGHCSKLKNLHLSHTLLESIDSSIKNCYALENLTLEGVELDSLPDFVFEMNLKRIVLKDSKIAKDSDYIQFLQRKMPATIMDC